MQYELISEEEFAALPEDDSLKFVAFEQICRRNMTSMIGEDTNGNFDSNVQLQYMTAVAAAAQELGFPDLRYPHDAEHPTRELGDFMLQASGIVTRIRLRSNSAAKALTVQLANRTRGLVELQIQKLRTIVLEGDLPEAKRKALLAKLDELSAELTAPRLSFAKTMAILAFVATGIASGTSFLADAPQAIATITNLIGKDKADEDAEAKRLGPPPPARKALPAPPMPVSPPSASWGRSAFDDDLDDDVPF